MRFPFDYLSQKSSSYFDHISSTLYSISNNPFVFVIGYLSYFNEILVGSHFSIFPACKACMSHHIKYLVILHLFAHFKIAWTIESRKMRSAMLDFSGNYFDCTKHRKKEKIFALKLNDYTSEKFDTAGDILCILFFH